LLTLKTVIEHCVKHGYTVIVLLQPNSFQLAITTNGSDDFIVLNFGTLHDYSRGVVR